MDGYEKLIFEYSKICILFESFENLKNQNVEYF